MRLVFPKTDAMLRQHSEDHSGEEVEGRHVAVVADLAVAAEEAVMKFQWESEAQGEVEEGAAAQDDMSCASCGRKNKCSSHANWCR
jgi:hypothetical protein